MDKQEFLKRFQLHRLSASSHDFRYHRPLKQAAVLIPLIEHQQQLQVILTRRASHLKHHAGQVSFPGGKVDEQDTDLKATALREAFEEISLAPTHAELLGQLHPYHTITGFVVTPIVALINNDVALIANDNEVAEIFKVPLSHFLNPDNSLSVTVQQRGKSHQVHFMPYQHYNIWGATAAMLKDLGDHLR